jgi:hypothetical protein
MRSEWAMRRHAGWLSCVVCCASSLVSLPSPDRALSSLSPCPSHLISSRLIVHHQHHQHHHRPARRPAHPIPPGTPRKRDAGPCPPAASELGASPAKARSRPAHVTRARPAGFAGLKAASLPLPPLSGQSLRSLLPPSCPPIITPTAPLKLPNHRSEPALAQELQVDQKTTARSRSGK